MFDGYGEPAALSLIVIGALFEKLTAHVGPPVGVAVGVDVLVEVGVAGVPVDVAVGVPQFPPVPFVPMIWND